MCCLGLRVLVIPRETLARIIIAFDWLISAGRSNFSVKRVPGNCCARALKLCTRLETVHAQSVANVERVRNFCRFPMMLAVPVGSLSIEHSLLLFGNEVLTRKELRPRLRRRFWYFQVIEGEWRGRKEVGRRKGDGNSPVRWEFRDKWRDLCPFRLIPLCLIPIGLARLKLFFDVLTVPQRSNSPQVSADIPSDLPACLLTINSTWGTCTLLMTPAPTAMLKGGTQRFESWQVKQTQHILVSSKLSKQLQKWRTAN